MSDAPQYEIQHIDDSLNVPEDGLDACLAKFRAFLRFRAAQRAIMNGIAEVILPGVKASTTAKLVWLEW